MNTTTTNSFEYQEPTLESLKRKARAYRQNQHPFSNKLSVVQRELRKRRKAFLGSSVPLTSIVWAEGEIDLNAISILTDYLSTRTVALWDRPYDEPLEFCRQFYEMAIIAVAVPSLRGQCLDDIIHLASFLSHEGKLAFRYAMTDLLPQSFYAKLFSFLDRVEGDCCIATFEDAVLGAVAVFLGVLEDPIDDDEEV